MKYTAITTNRTARPRSKRLREQGIGGSVSSTVVLNGEAGGGGAAGGGTAGDGHTHANKPALDQITTDSDGYQYLTQYKEVEDPETGETEVQAVTEKVKAGFADFAHDLTEDSPVREQFLSRLVDDVAKGNITFEQMITVLGQAVFEQAITVQGQALFEQMITVLGQATLKGGAEFGAYQPGQSGAKVDGDGNAELGKLLARTGVVSDRLESKEFTSGPFGTGFLVKRDPATGKSYIEADEIYIRLKAYFEALEIKHLSHAGGRVVLSPAGMECVKVELADAEYEAVYDSTGEQLYDAGGDEVLAPKGSGSQVYRCYFKQKDGEKEIANEFAVGDLAQCREFNVKAGVSSQAGNQYYWRKVVAVGDDFIDLSMTDCDAGSMEPKAGDTIVTVGNATDPARQHVVFLSSYDDDAPCIKLYSGINTYSMLNKEVTVISPNADKNVFTGRMVIKPGSTGFGNLADAPDLAGIKSSIQEAVGNASAAKEAAESAQNAVTNLNTYVDGAFADGIVSEAEAAAIEKYINTVNQTKKEVDSTYAKLYANSYLDGAAKVSLANAYASMGSAVTNLTNAINTAIADGTATAAEKQDVDTKFATFNTAYATFCTAVETANQAIQEKLKSYSDNALAAANTANNNASAAMETATNAKNAVTSLNTYVDGAFADGIISEAEAAAIEKYINTVNQTKKEADSTYTVLYANAFLTGTAKSSLYSAKASFDTATTNLTNSINAAIADGTATSAEKQDVDTKFATFNTAYANLATAIENANKAIQAKIKEEAVNEAASAVESQIGEVTQEAKDDIAKKMGYASYAQLEQAAARGETVIQGGSINTNLINASLIVTSALIASAIRAGTLNVNDKFKVYTDGSVDMNGILHSIGSNTEAVMSNGYLRIMYGGVEKLRISVNETTGLPEISLTHGNRIVQLTAEKLVLGITGTSANNTFLTIDPSILGTGTVRKTSDGILYIAAGAEATYTTVTLSVSPAGSGTTSPAEGTRLAVVGDSEYVEALPADGYQFDHWSDGGAQRHLVTWTAGKSLTAYFTVKQAASYTVTLLASPTAGGTVSGGGTYAEGTTRTVTATPASGYVFVRWSDGKSQSHTVTWDANKTLTAYFEAKATTSDEILLGTDLADGTYLSTAGDFTGVSAFVNGNSIKVYYTTTDIVLDENAPWTLFNKGYLGSKLKQGHTYRLTFQAKTSAGTAAAVAGIGDVGGSAGVDDISNGNDMIYGDELSSTYQTFTIDITARRDSTAADAVFFWFLPGSKGQIVSITAISLKEV